MREARSGGGSWDATTGGGWNHRRATSAELSGAQFSGRDLREHPSGRQPAGYRGAWTHLRRQGRGYSTAAGPSVGWQGEEKTRSAKLEQGCVRMAFAICAKRPCDRQIARQCPFEEGCHSHSATIPSAPEPRLTCKGSCGVLGATVCCDAPCMTPPVSSPVQAAHFIFVTSYDKESREWIAQPDVATPGALTSHLLQTLQ
jgi:hypothetical protein